MGPDLVIAWLIGSRPDGFLLAPLSQLSGGVLLLGATFGLARLTDLSQRTALGAMVLVLGMANVAVQFTTVQSDLFTAGVFSASFFLWHRSLLRGESSAVAGIGLALAFGSKGTMFYFAPGAVLWIICLAWKHRIPWKAGLITVSWAAVAALVFVGPSLWRNFQTYGGLFGPREAVVQQHGRTLSLTQQVDKLALNLCSSGVQLFDPNAQPYWMQGFCRSAGQRITRMLSNETDPYIFMEVSRRAQLEQVMEFTEPDCDLLTCGIQAVLLFFWGLTIAVIFRSRFKGASLILVWGAGVLLFLLVQHTMVQWHHWSFRFMVLAAPWVAVVSAWGVSKLPRKLRVGVWTIAIFSSLQVFVVVQWRSPQAAWRAVTAPDHTLAHFVYHRWRDWTRTLDPAGSGITLALPINEPIAAFTRMGDGRLIALQRMKALPATAESAVQSLDGWLVVPVGYFNGREGRVEKRVWILNGDEQSQFSLAAYRRLEVKR
jgi:hypothetical protein